MDRGHVSETSERRPGARRPQPSARNLCRLRIALDEQPVACLALGLHGERRGASSGKRVEDECAGRDCKPNEGAHEGERLQGCDWVLRWLVRAAAALWHRGRTGPFLSDEALETRLTFFPLWLRV